MSKTCFAGAPRALALMFGLVVIGTPVIAGAQDDTAPATAPPATPTTPPTPEPQAPPPTTPAAAAANAPVVAAPVAETPPVLKLTVAGYAEAYYSYNFGIPSNGITNFRWLDNRHNTITLATAVLDVTGEMGRISTRIALQVGPTAEGWYTDGSEQRAPSGGASALSASTWRHLQQAYVSYSVPDVARGLTVQAGLFTTPIGYEAAAVKDNWNWSRSNLFLALPFYHAAARATLDVTKRISVMAMVSNGWNLATDNNDGKSVTAQILYKVPDALSLALLYMGGPERAQSAPEGRPWRHLFDAWGQWDVTSSLSLAAHGTAGLESNAFGTQSWKGGALYARVRPLERLYLAARADALFEDIPAGASPLFFGAQSVGSLTFTADVRPVDNLSVRLEYRHDVADTEIYFHRTVATDPVTQVFVANAKTQDTATLGATAWF